MKDYKSRTYGKTINGGTKRAQGSSIVAIPGGFDQGNPGDNTPLSAIGGQSGSGSNEKYCWWCGKTDHAGRECPFYESWVVWDLDQDCAVLKKFQLKADHPPNPPDPPFQTDPSKKWWKSLNKNQGYGSKLYKNAQHWKKRQGQKNKKQKIAAASDSKSKSHANRIEMEKGKDYSELLNVLADTMVLNLDDPKDCELAQKASAEGYGFRV